VTIRARKSQLLTKITDKLRNLAVIRHSYRYPRSKNQSYSIPEIYDHLNENAVRGLLSDYGERSASRSAHYNALL
jgi:hypothetical protein